MTSNSIEVVKLAPMKMINFYGYGEHPETTAWEKALKWLKSSNYKLKDGENRVFGFNNPCPSAGSSNYGYEIWISIQSDFHPTDDIRLVDFSGGLYATTSFTIQNPAVEMPKYWKALNLWCETSSYSFASHQWLEEHSFDGKPIAMFLPISQ